MKKIWMMLILMAAFAFPAQAEIVGRTQESYIHSYTADNRQTLFFVSREEEPFVRTEDVNFDGHDDVVMLTTLGASNGFFEFFVWDGAQYVLAARDAFFEGIPNYELYPEKGIVSASVSSGWAGLLHETVLFCWEGTTMHALRRAVSEELVTSDFEGSLFTQTTDSSQVHMCVTEQAWDEQGLSLEPRVLYEATISAEEAQTDALELLAGEEAALWNGL